MYVIEYPIFMPQARRRSRTLLPDLVLARRLDVVDVIGRGLATTLTSRLGLRPIAEQLGVPHTTLRSWLGTFSRTVADVAGPVLRAGRGAGRNGDLT